MKPAEYLKMPYQRCVVPDSDGSYRAEINEFPGCIATGDTASEALANLEDVAASWLEVALEQGLRIPEPMDNSGFSGKLVLRLPKTLHRKAAHAAAREGVSLNQFIVASLAEHIGGVSIQANRANALTASNAVAWAYYLNPAHVYGHMRTTLCDRQIVVTMPVAETAVAGSGHQFTKLPEQRHARD